MQLTCHLSVILIQYLKAHMSSTSGRNAKNNDENEVDEEDENGHTVDKDVSGTPVVLNTGIQILTSL